MIRKIVMIAALAVLPLFAVMCTDNSGSGGDASVRLNFDGANGIQSIEGIPVIRAISKSSTIQPDVASIRVKVYVGNEADGALYDETMPVTDNITMEIPSGTARIFKVYGIDSTGYAKYAGVSAPVDLAAGEDQVVSIALSTATADAAFSVKLLGEDGITDFADPGYLASTGNKLTAEVFKPAITYNVTTSKEEVVMGPVIGISVSSTSFVTSLTGLTAYATTPQIIIVRAFTLDGTIAAIGMAAFSDLSGGLNSVPVTVVMSRPGRISIINNAAITSVKVEMEIGGTGGTSYYKEVAASGIISADGLSIMVAVPNHKLNIGSGQNLGLTRNVRITLNNGTPKVISIPSSMVVQWKLIEVNFAAGSWVQK